MSNTNVSMNSQQQTKTPSERWVLKQIKIEDARLKKKSAILNKAIEKRKKKQDLITKAKKKHEEELLKKYKTPEQLNEKFIQAEKRRKENQSKQLEKVKMHNTFFVEKIKNYKKKQQMMNVNVELIEDHHLVVQLNRLREQNKTLDEKWESNGLRSVNILGLGRRRIRRD